MIAYLTDTNVLVAVLKRSDLAVQRRLRIHRNEIALSAIVLFGLHFGAQASERVRHNAEQLEHLDMPVLPFDAVDARTAAEIRADLKRRGCPIGPYDTLIAGQALARGLTVVTANRREFERVEGLRVEDWTA